MQAWLLTCHQFKRLLLASAGISSWFKFSLRNSALQVVDQKKVCSQHILPVPVGFWLVAREIYWLAGRKMKDTGSGR